MSHAHASLVTLYYGIPRNNECFDRNTSPCTSLEQIRKDSVEELVRFKQISGCPIVITGGTETYTHGPNHWDGLKTDLRVNSCIDRFVKEKYTYIGRRSDGAEQWESPEGNIFALELTGDPHWDVFWVVMTNYHLFGTYYSDENCQNVYAEYSYPRGCVTDGRSSAMVSCFGNVGFVTEYKNSVNCGTEKLFHSDSAELKCQRGYGYSFKAQCLSRQLSDIAKMKFSDLKQLIQREDIK